MTIPVAVGLGRLPSTDARNDQHPMTARLPRVSAPLPTKRRWAFLGDPLNQGQSGTCAGHAGAHFLHAAPIRHKAFIDAFQLYREAVLLDEYGDNDGDATCVTTGCNAGTSGTGVAKALDKRGLLVEYLWAQTTRDLVEWVLTRGPVMVGTNWYSSMFTPDRQGFVKIDPTATVDGGHEYVVLGVDTKQGVAELVNSWGPTWNARAAGIPNHPVRPGHFLMDFTVLERLFHEDGDAVSAIEKAKARG